MRYYIDTCIWIDFIEDRKGFDEEPLGNYAHRLFAFIRSQKHVIVVNDFLVAELNSHYPESEIITLFSLFRTSNIVVEPRHKKEARKICMELFIPYGDALHAVLSRGSILITRDKHFRKIPWCDPLAPEDII